MKKIVVLIPALNPNEDFLDYSRELVKNDNVDLIVVNDGSRVEKRYIFDELSKLNNTVVLTHAINLGKGRALKTGFNYYINSYDNSNSAGIVTADSDGQHRIEDVLRIGKMLNEGGANTIILGTRNFNLDNVPFKSRKGNKITTFVFSLLYGKKINDTQTGLRGLSYDFVVKLIDLGGERFDYEINMLIKSVRDKVNIKEEIIETVYFDNNSETHFNPIKDSFRIYKVMFKEFFKFSISGLSSSLIDILLFTLFYNLLKSNVSESVVIFLPTILARAISSFYNYIINKTLVFRNKEKNTIFKYYILCVVQALVSYGLVNVLFNNINVIHPSFIKIVVDIVLFLLSYQIQQRWVFKGKGEK